MGSFRKDNSSDPEIFARSLIAVLSDYDDDVIEAAIDPRSGLPSKQSFMPTIHELKSALEAIEGPRRKQRQREKQIADQIEERKQIADQREVVKSTYQDLQAKCHEVGLMIGVKGGASPEADEQTKARNVRDTQRHHVAITEEWARAGQEPQMCGDIPVSKALCDLIHKQTGVTPKVKP